MKTRITVGVVLIAWSPICSALSQEQRPAQEAVAETQVVAQTTGCLAHAKLTLIVNPPKVLLTQSSTITWEAVVSDACGPVTTKLDGQVVQDSETKTIVPTLTRNIVLTVSQGVSGKTQTLTAVAPISVGFPDRVVINSTTPDPVNTVVGALESDNDTDRRAVRSGAQLHGLVGYSSAGKPFADRVAGM